MGIGAPNTGKSSLLNRLVGFDRSRAADEPETTRDTLEIPCVYRGRKLRILDTAGLGTRRQKGGSDLLRNLHNATLKAIQYAHVVIVVVDATTGFPSRHDMSLMHHAL